MKEQKQQIPSTRRKFDSEKASSGTNRSLDLEQLKYLQSNLNENFDKKVTLAPTAEGIKIKTKFGDIKAMELLKSALKKINIDFENTEDSFINLSTSSGQALFNNYKSQEIANNATLDKGGTSDNQERGRAMSKKDDEKKGSKELGQDSEIAKNAFNQKANPKYEYRDIDIQLLQSKIMNPYLGSFIIHKFIGDNSSTDKTLEELIGSLKDDKPTLCIFNLGNWHWVVFAALKMGEETYVLYKDSKGLNNERLEKRIKEKNEAVKFIVNTKKEQTSGLECGIFALKNMEILAENISQNKDEFIKGFTDFKGFCSLRVAQHLRKEEFAKKYLLGQYQAMVDEAIKSSTLSKLREKHDPEAQKVESTLKKLGLFKDVNIKALTTYEKFEPDRDKNSIIIEIAMDHDTNLENNNYTYGYRISWTEGVPMDSILIIQNINAVLNLNEGANHCIVNEKDRVIYLPSGLLYPITIDYNIPAIKISELMQNLSTSNKEEVETILKQPLLDSSPSISNPEINNKINTKIYEYLIDNISPTIPVLDLNNSAISKNSRDNSLTSSIKSQTNPFNNSRSLKLLDELIEEVYDLTPLPYKSISSTINGIIKIPHNGHSLFNSVIAALPQKNLTIGILRKQVSIFLEQEIKTPFNGKSQMSFKDLIHKHLYNSIADAKQHFSDSDFIPFSTFPEQLHTKLLYASKIQNPKEVSQYIKDHLILDYIESIKYSGENDKEILIGGGIELTAISAIYDKRFKLYESEQYDEDIFKPELFVKPYKTLVPSREITLRLVNGHYDLIVDEDSYMAFNTQNSIQTSSDPQNADIISDPDKINPKKLLKIFATKQEFIEDNLAQDKDTLDSIKKIINDAIHQSDIDLLSTACSQIGNLMTKITRFDKDKTCVRNKHGYINPANNYQRNDTGAKLDFETLSYLEELSQNTEWKTKLNPDEVKSSLIIIEEKVDFILADLRIREEEIKNSPTPSIKKDISKANQRSKESEESGGSDIGFLKNLASAYHDYHCINAIVKSLSDMSSEEYKVLDLYKQSHRYYFGYLVKEIGEKAKELSDFLKPEGDKTNSLKELFRILKEYRNIIKTTPEIVISQNESLKKLKQVIDDNHKVLSNLLGTIHKIIEGKGVYDVNFNQLIKDIEDRFLNEIEELNQKLRAVLPNLVLDSDSQSKLSSISSKIKNLEVKKERLEKKQDELKRKPDSEESVEDSASSLTSALSDKDISKIYLELGLGSNGIKNIKLINSLKSDSVHTTFESLAKAKSAKGDKGFSKEKCQYSSELICKAANRPLSEADILKVISYDTKKCLQQLKEKTKDIEKELLDVVADLATEKIKLVEIEKIIFKRFLEELNFQKSLISNNKEKGDILEYAHKLSIGFIREYCRDIKDCESLELGCRQYTNKILQEFMSNSIDTGNKIMHLGIDYKLVEKMFQQYILPSLRDIEAVDNILNQQLNETNFRKLEATGQSYQRLDMHDDAGKSFQEILNLMHNRKIEMPTSSSSNNNEEELFEKYQHLKPSKELVDSFVISGAEIFTLSKNLDVQLSKQDFKEGLAITDKIIEKVKNFSKPLIMASSFLYMFPSYRDDDMIKPLLSVLTSSKNTFDERLLYAIIQKAYCTEGLGQKYQAFKILCELELEVDKGQFDKNNKQISSMLARLYVDLARHCIDQYPTKIQEYIDKAKALSVNDERSFLMCLNFECNIDPKSHISKLKDYFYKNKAKIKDELGTIVFDEEMRVKLFELYTTKHLSKQSKDIIKSIEEDLWPNIHNLDLKNKFLILKLKRGHYEGFNGLKNIVKKYCALNVKHSAEHNILTYIIPYLSVTEATGIFGQKCTDLFEKVKQQYDKRFFQTEKEVLTSQHEIPDVISTSLSHKGELIEKRLLTQFSQAKISSGCEDANISIPVDDINRADLENYFRTQFNNYNPEIESYDNNYIITLDKRGIEICQMKLKAKIQDKIVAYSFVEYDNPILNDPKITELFKLAREHYGVKGINRLIEIGSNNSDYTRFQSLRQRIGDEKAMSQLLDRDELTNSMQCSLDSTSKVSGLETQLGNYFISSETEESEIPTTAILGTGGFISAQEGGW